MTNTTDKGGRARPRIQVEALPPDIWWPHRVHVATAGDCVPFELMLAWHAQFLTDRATVWT